MKLGKLKKKIAILKKSEAREEERKKLEAEYKGLKSQERTRVFTHKHGKKIAIVKGVGTGVARVGRGLGIMAKGILKKARESEGLKRQYEQMYGKQPQPKRKIAIIKKKKRKR